MSSRIHGNVPCIEIDVPAHMLAAGVARAVAIQVGRTVAVVTVWDDGMEAGSTYSGGGSARAANDRALQRAFESGARLRERWAAARREEVAS